MQSAGTPEIYTKIHPLSKELKSNKDYEFMFQDLVNFLHLAIDFYVSSHASNTYPSFREMAQIICTQFDAVYYLIL